MTQRTKSLNVIEYMDWIRLQGFSDPKELHMYVPKQEQDFLQHVIYPMFYSQEFNKFKTCIPFPLILKDYSTRKPKYVIDTKYFTIVFFSNDSFDEEYSWKVSVHIKEKSFCEDSILEFKMWYYRHYTRFLPEMFGMPKEFLYPKLNFSDKVVKDFCIEFYGEEKDFILFKFMDLLRLF